MAAMRVESETVGRNTREIGCYTAMGGVMAPDLHLHLIARLFLHLVARLFLHLVARLFRLHTAQMLCALECSKNLHQTVYDPAALVRRLDE